MLNITEVRIKKINKGDLLAAASICIDDCFIIREIKLLNGNKVYVYISKSPVIQHNFQFNQDLKVAKFLNEKLKEFYK